MKIAVYLVEKKVLYIPKNPGLRGLVIKCLYSILVLRNRGCAETLSHSTFRHAYNIP